MFGKTSESLFDELNAAILPSGRIALEWGPYGVTANALCPGPFDTPLNASIKNDPVAYRQFLEKIPLGRWGDPRELACAVVFLAASNGAIHARIVAATAAGFILAGMVAAIRLPGNRRRRPSDPVEG